MGIIAGDRSVEIDAPIQHVFAIAADLDHAPAWQGSLRDVSVTRTDSAGRAAEADMVNDAKVAQLKSRMAFSYDEPRSMRWHQLKGDVKDVEGSWRFEELGEGRTRATYALSVDPGRVIGMLLRGPVAEQVKNLLLSGAAEGLKRKSEETAPGAR